MAEELDSFLTSGAQPPGADAPPPPPPQEAPPVDSTASEAKEPAAPAPEVEEETERSPDGRSIPVEAFHKARTDWKTKTVAAETEARLLREQLELAKRPPPEPEQPRQLPPPIDPSADPVGYHNRVQGVMLNERLNMSEMMERKEHKAEDFDAAVALFKEEGAKDRRLFEQLYSQPHPYNWLMGEVKRIQLQRDIGNDPAGYEKRMREKWAAEEAAKNTAPPVSPAAGLAPSLASVRTGMPRSNSGYTGPMSMDDILTRPRRGASH